MSFASSWRKSVTRLRRSGKSSQWRPVMTHPTHDQIRVRARQRRRDTPKVLAAARLTGTFLQQGRLFGPNRECAHGYQRERSQRTFPRYPQGHLLRRKANTESVAENGQGGEIAGFAGRFRKPP